MIGNAYVNVVDNLMFFEGLDVISSPNIESSRELCYAVLLIIQSFYVSVVANLIFVEEKK